MPIPSPDQLTTFSSLPLSSSPSSSADSPSFPAQEGDTYLLATIKSNLTITKPTLILTDSSNQDFALVFDPPFQVSEPRNPNAVVETFKALGLKKGATVVIKNARRTRAEREGGQGFVVLGSLGLLEEEMGTGTREGGSRSRSGKGSSSSEKGDEKGEGKEGGEAEGGELLGMVSAPIAVAKKMLEVLRQRDETSPPKEREEKMCDRKFDGCATPSGKEGDGKGLKRCQGCLEVWYCSKECQTKSWTGHKDECKTIKALRRIWPRHEGVE